MYALKAHASIRDIPRSAWDALVPSGEPFLRWDFFRILEDSDCLTPESGWHPAYITVEHGESLAAAAPAFFKGNSEGEFVFDHAWAQFAYERLKHEYYPKLVVASPFTPATGPRLLCKELDPALTAAFVQGLQTLCSKAGVSSAHVLFPRKEEATALAKAGMLLRHGIQYHWHNAGYDTFDDFLARYPSKKRKQLNRERRAIAEAGLELRTLTAEQLTPDVVDHLYRFYSSTVDKHVWGRRYLTRAFFEELAGVMKSSLVVVLAYERGSQRPMAGALDYRGGNRLFGRYWGADRDERFLHFNVCYYAGIEFCIEEGLECFEPGAGGEHKVARGFDPTVTYSAHELRHPVLTRVVEDFLERERQAVEQAIRERGSVLRDLPGLASSDSTLARG